MDRLRGRRARAAAGFTLIEVMIALGMLAAGLLTVAVAQLYAMQGGTSGRHASEAATVAHSWIENLQRRSFDDPELEETGGLWTEEVEVPATIQIADEAVEMIYRRQYRVTDVDAALKAIDVRVTWDEPKRPGRSLTLSSQIHDDPPTGG